MFAVAGRVNRVPSRLSTFDRQTKVRCATPRSQRNVKCNVWWLWNNKEANPLLSEQAHAPKLVSIEGESDQGNIDGVTDDHEYEIKNISSIDQVSSSEWNACVVDSSGEENPFLLHEFLNSLEQSGSAVRLTGWFPYHLTMRRKSDQLLVGCCPLYLKNHSRGEYVFDYQWAQISHYTGNKYYPKLQSCVPFTPVTGSRLLVNPSCKVDTKNIKRALAVGLKEVTGSHVFQLNRKMFYYDICFFVDTLNVSSLHLTFNSEEEQELLNEEGYLGRIGVQYHWENPGYASFDEFLMELKQSKRKSIRQERKCLTKANLKVERLVGDDIKAHHWDQFFEFYYDTCEKKYGDAYLNREFFHMLGESMNGKVLLVLAKNELDGYVAGAWNCIGTNTLFGRNWGKLDTFYQKHLHFELCYYQALEAAIEMKLKKVEAGAQGEHKIQRGYLPKTTYSSHYIRNDVLKHNIQRLVENEKMHLEDAIEYMNYEYSPFK